MNTFENVIAQPASLQARRELAAEWTKAAHPQARLLSLAMAEHDGLPRLEAKAARREIRELVDQHGREWAGRIGELASWYKYELGLISACAVSGDTLVRHGDELFALAPILSLGVSEPLRLTEILKMPQLKQLKKFYVESSELNDAGALQLAECANLANVILGSIDCRGLTNIGLQALLNSPYFDNMVACSLILPERLANRPMPDGRQSIFYLNEQWFLYNDAATAKPWAAAVAEAQLGYTQHVFWPPLLDGLYWTE